VWDYLHGGPCPALLEMAWAIDRYGATAVLGDKVLSVSEARQMATAADAVAAWRSRERSDDWVEWAKANPQANQLITDWLMR
jgi:hypothetical protein